MADYQDLCMYIRIVNGINNNNNSSSKGSNRRSVANADETVKHIIRTRHSPVRESTPPFQDELLFLRNYEEEQREETPHVEYSRRKTESSFNESSSLPVMCKLWSRVVDSAEDDAIFVLDM
jgi:hypothetical protein